jgi:hypothetical protein
MHGKGRKCFLLVQKSIYCYNPSLFLPPKIHVWQPLWNKKKRAIKSRIQYKIDGKIEALSYIHSSGSHSC